MKLLRVPIFIGVIFLSFSASAAGGGGSAGDAGFQKCMSFLLNREVGDFKETDWRALHHSTFSEIGKNRPLGHEEFLKLRSLTVADVEEFAEAINAGLPPKLKAGDSASLHLRIVFTPSNGVQERDRLSLAVQRRIFTAADVQVQNLRLSQVQLPSLSRFTLRYMKTLAMLTHFTREGRRNMIPKDMWSSWERVYEKMQLDIIAFADGSVVISEFSILDGFGNVRSRFGNSDINEFDTLVVLGNGPGGRAGDDREFTLTGRMKAELDGQIQQLQDRAAAIGDQFGRLDDTERPSRAYTVRMVHGYSGDLALHRKNRDAVEREIRLLTSRP